MNFNDIVVQKKDSSIKVVRVTAMLMIVACHLCTYLGHSALGLVLDVGVQIFLFVSGWLYGEKRIDHAGKWLINRWLIICIPAYIWTMFMYVFALFSGNPQKEDSMGYIITHFLNIQGWNKVFPGYPLKWLKCVVGCGHMWFLTALMFCYFVMIVVKKVVTEETKERTKETIIRRTYCIVGAICVCLGAYIGICFEWLYIFFLGYILRKSWKKISAKQYITVTVAMILAMAIRLGGKVFLDDTIYYEQMIVFLTHNVLAIWIIATIRMVDQRTKSVEELAHKKIVNWLDRYSYYIYIVHFGILEICDTIKTDKLYGRIIAFIVLTIIAAVLLKKMSDFFMRHMGKGVYEKKIC